MIVNGACTIEFSVAFSEIVQNYMYAKNNVDYKMFKL